MGRRRRKPPPEARKPDRKPVLALLAADQLRALHSAAMEAIDASREEGWMGDDEDEEGLRSNERFYAALETLRFVAVAAGVLRDASLLPLVSESLKLFEDYESRCEDHKDTMGFAVTRLLAAGAPAGPEVEELASDPDPKLRTAVAEGLLPGDATSRRLLEKLATDESPDVRTAARARLAGVAEVPWWMGKFADDPFRRLGPEEAERHGPAIRTICELLDEPWFQIEKTAPKIASLVEELPVPIGLEVVEHLLAGHEPWGSGETPKFLAWMLAHEGSWEPFLRLIERWQKGRSAHDADDAAVAALVSLPIDRRSTLCRQILLHANALPEALRLEQGGVAHILAETVGKAWPPDLDLSPLLEAILAAPPREQFEIDWVVAGFEKVFKQKGLDLAPWLDRAIEAKLADWPGPWRHMHSSIDPVIEGLPRARLRPIVDRAVASENPSVLLWGVRQWLLHVHDPARDPKKAELVKTLFAVPKVRATIRENAYLLPLFLPLARAELAAGKLGFHEAAEVMQAIHNLYGGQAEGFVEWRHSPEEREASRARARKELAGLLGPKKNQGPATDAEWQAYRRVRGPEHFEKDRDEFMAMAIIPEGPWRPDDRAFIDQMIEKWRGGDQDLDIFLAHTLSVNPLPSDLAVLDAMLLSATGDDRGYLRADKRRAMKRLGIATGEPGGGEESEEDEDSGEDDLDDWADDDGDED